MSVIEKAIEWALGIAADSSHGYDQTHRWGPDYDCSSLVISAFKAAGLPLTSTYTGNMKADFLRNGFIVAPVIEMGMGAGLKRGDVLLNEKNHTALYLGDGTMVEARINEHGGIKGGQTGDQTGREICISTYRNYPWDVVLRYGGLDEARGTEYDEPIPVYSDEGFIRRGQKGLRVQRLQSLLIYFHGINCGPDGVDGDFGPNTENAVKVFQSKFELDGDGVVGPETTEALLSGVKL